MFWQGPEADEVAFLRLISMFMAEVKFQLKMASPVQTLHSYAVLVNFRGRSLENSLYM